MSNGLSNLEKIIIGAWIGVLLLIIAAIRLPSVHKVNTACCSANECAIQHHHEKVANEPLTEAQLKLFYDGLNEDYYFGQLPKDVVIHWGNLTANNWMGTTEHEENSPYRITVDRATNPTSSGAEFTVAHETCHIKTWGLELDSHGPKFQRCMVNLATHGAFEGIW